MATMCGRSPRRSSASTRTSWPCRKCIARRGRRASAISSRSWSRAPASTATSPRATSSGGADTATRSSPAARSCRREVHPLPCIGEPRALLEATIRIDGATISFYATHLTTWGRLNSKIRAEQLQCLAREVRASRYPYILAGDFNTAPHSPEMEAFRRENAAQLAIEGDRSDVSALERADRLHLRRPRLAGPRLARLADRDLGPPAGDGRADVGAGYFSLALSLYPRQAHPSSGRRYPEERDARARRLPKPWPPWSWSPG